MDEQLTEHREVLPPLLQHESQGWVFYRLWYLLRCQTTAAAQHHPALPPLRAHLCWGGCQTPPGFDIRLCKSTNSLKHSKCPVRCQGFAFSFRLHRKVGHMEIVDVYRRHPQLLCPKCHPWVDTSLLAQSYQGVWHLWATQASNMWKFLVYFKHFFALFLIGYLFIYHSICTPHNFIEFLITIWDILEVEHRNKEDNIFKYV